MAQDQPKDRPIKLGIIGCGAFAQLMHLRIIADLPEFELVVLCDSSAEVVDALAERYNVAGRYTSVDEALDHPGLDAVLIANRDHYEVVAAALDKGKHVLVEKPLCLDPAEGRDLIERADAAGVVAMVGYMKRYDWGFQELTRRLPELGEPRLVRVHDFKSQFHIPWALYDLVRRTDVPAAEKEAEMARMRASMTSAVGEDGNIDLYRIILFFASHDLNVMRGMFGEPLSIDAVRANGNDTIVAMLDYGHRGPSLLELSAATDFGWFEEEITVAGATEMLSLRFPHPYVHYGQSELTLHSHDGVATRQERVLAPYSDGFRRTWEHFAHYIYHGGQPITSFRDGLADLELAVELTRRSAS
ncbi:MAG: oxidoreductase domain protein [Subtercola sp.]|nr:oxidoreductase domain protein [Subtercola sp.]